jgi:hypothetical protein
MTIIFLIIVIVVFMVLAFPAFVLLEIVMLLFTLLLVISDISTIRSKTLPNQKRRKKDMGVCEMVVDDTMEALSEVGDVVDLAADAVVYTGATVASATSEIVGGAIDRVGDSAEVIIDDIKKL